MADETAEQTSTRPTFAKHFFFITLGAAVASAAMDTLLGNGLLPSQFGNRMAFFIGSGLGAALLGSLAYWVARKGGSRNPIGAAWGAAAFMMFFILIHHLSQAKLLP